MFETVVSRCCHHTPTRGDCSVMSSRTVKTCWSQPKCNRYTNPRFTYSLNYLPCRDILHWNGINSETRVISPQYPYSRSHFFQDTYHKNALVDLTNEHCFILFSESAISAGRPLPTTAVWTIIVGRRKCTRASARRVRAVRYIFGRHGIGPQCDSRQSNLRPLDHKFNALTTEPPPRPVPAYVAVFTAQCTSVQSAVLRSHVVRPSVCPSVCNVGGLWSHRLEIFETY